MISSVVILSYLLAGEYIDGLADMDEGTIVTSYLFGIIIGIIGVLLMRTYYKPQTIDINKQYVFNNK